MASIVIICKVLMRVSARSEVRLLDQEAKKRIEIRRNGGEQAIQARKPRKEDMLNFGGSDQRLSE